MDSRDTASAAFDVARPAGDAARRAGVARASQDGAAQCEGRHAEEADGAEQADGLAADGPEQAAGLAADAEQAPVAARRHGQRSCAARRPSISGAGLASRRSGSVPPPTIYDVASAAGVSIASVSRVLNGRGNPMPETRERVMAAVAELGFVPDDAARALSARLKEIIGVIIRLPSHRAGRDEMFEDEEDSLQFPDLINRGIAQAAQNRDFDLLVRSVDVDEHAHPAGLHAGPQE